MKQHRKSKDPKVRRTLELVRRTASRAPMGRPVIFQDKTKYSRKRLPRPSDED